MDVSEAKRLKQLEEESSKLKRLLADAGLDNVALKDLLLKNSDARRQARRCRPSCCNLRDERAPGLWNPGALLFAKTDGRGFASNPFYHFRGKGPLLSCELLELRQVLATLEESLNGFNMKGSSARFQSV